MILCIEITRTIRQLVETLLLKHIETFRIIYFHAIFQSLKNVLNPLPYDSICF